MTGQKIRQTPIAIGGIGGSGTRVIANILQDAGFYLGDDLNISMDNLWFTLFFKQNGINTLSDCDFENRVSHFVAAMTDDKNFNVDTNLIYNLAEQNRLQHDMDWLNQRAESFFKYKANPSQLNMKWAWKEPNTHISIDRLKNSIPRLKYIHLMRHGLDMAFSKNLNQLVFWGDEVLQRPFQRIPKDALSYWVQVHEALEQKLLQFEDGEKLIIQFEDLCINPEEIIRQILNFCNAEMSEISIEKLLQQITLPKSVGRYQDQDLSQFNTSDLKALSKFGYNIGDRK